MIMISIERLMLVIDIEENRFFDDEKLHPPPYR